MMAYPESTREARELEAMRGAELIYFVIPEAALWSTVNVLAVLDGPLDLDTLRKRALHASHRFPRMRQRPVRKKKVFYWEAVDDVRIDDHLRVVDTGVARQGEIEKMVSLSMSTPLDISRPLWELLYFPRYEDGAAVLLRIHHAYGDGRSLQAMMTSLLATTREASLKELEAVGTPARHQAVAAVAQPPGGRRSRHSAGEDAGRLVRGMRLQLAGWRRMAAAFRKDHDTGFDEMPSAERVAAFSRALSRTQLRRASAQLGCTLNDFVLAAVAGAVRRNLLRSGKDPVGARISVVVPVDLHSPRSLHRMRKAGLMTNHLGTATLRLPVALADGAERARSVGRAITESIECGEPVRQYRSLSSFHRMPQGLLVKMFRSQAYKLSGIVSNIAGPKLPCYLAGSRMRSWVFWVSAPQLAGAHLGVSVSHYIDEVRIGLTLPVNTGYDVHELVEEMAVETEELMRYSPAAAAISV